MAHFAPPGAPIARLSCKPGYRNSSLANFLRSALACTEGLGFFSPRNLLLMNHRAFGKLGLRFRPEHTDKPTRHMGNAQECIVKSTTQAFAARFPNRNCLEGSSVFHNPIFFGISVPLTIIHRRHRI